MQKVTAIKTEAEEESSIQLGMFPGLKYISADSEQEKPRLAVEVQIKITDRKTGESFIRKIPLDLDSGDLVSETIRAAVNHNRTLDDIGSFVEGRND